MKLTLTKQETIFGWFFLLAQFLAVPFAVALVCAGLGIRSEATINIASFFVNAVLALVIFRRLLITSVHRFFSRPKQSLVTAVKGFALYWAVNLAVTGLTKMIAPDFGNVNDQNILAMLAEQPLLMGLAVIFAAPLAEE